ncbi:MAG: hypothetical protein QM695_09745 [Micropruina sp.]
MLRRISCYNTRSEDCPTIGERSRQRRAGGDTWASEIGASWVLRRKRLGQIAGRVRRSRDMLDQHRLAIPERAPFPPPIRSISEPLRWMYCATLIGGAQLGV